MARKTLLWSLTACVLFGCSTTPATWPAWVRKDGKPITGNPTLEEAGKSDLLQCRAKAVQAAGQVDMPTSVTIGDYAIGGSGESRQKLVQNTVASTTLEACMDERGYRQILVPAE